MIFLLLAIFSSTAVSVMLRLSNDTDHSVYGKFVCNYLACAVCALLFRPLFLWDAIVISLGLMNGVLLVVGLFLMQLSMRLSGVALTSLYGRLGVCVPLLFSIVFFKEWPTWLQVLGMASSLLSILWLFYQSKMSFQIGAVLLIFMVASGLGDTMSKIYQVFAPDVLSSQYFFISFLVAMLLSLFLMILKKQTITKKEVLYGVMIGIPNYFSSFFLLLSLNDLPSIVVYPTYSTATIVTISLCGYVFFKEKVNKEMIATFILILVSIGLLNI